MEDIKTVVKNIAKITFLIIANLFGDLQCKTRRKPRIQSPNLNWSTNHVLSCQDLRLHFLTVHVSKDESLYWSVTLVPVLNKDLMCVLIRIGICVDVWAYRFYIIHFKIIICVSDFCWIKVTNWIAWNTSAARRWGSLLLHITYWHYVYHHCGQWPLKTPVEFDI